MSVLFISLLTLILILISAFVILLVLMQKTSQSGGMGAALGGGAAESAFGSDTNNVLTKATIYSIIAFFLVSLGLFLIYQSKAAERSKAINPEELIRSAESDTSEPNLVEDLITETTSKVGENLEEAPSEADLPAVDSKVKVERVTPDSK